MNALNISPTTGRLNRVQVAEILDTSVTSLRRLEGDELHPVQDESGAWMFDPAEVEALRARRAAPAPVQPEVAAEPVAQVVPPPAVVVPPPAVVAPLPDDGDVAADVFDDLDSGKSPTEVVRKRRLAPDRVTGLFEQWRAMKAMDLSAPSVPRTLKRLHATVAALTAQLDVVTKKLNATPLAGLRNRFKCKDCGESGYLGIRVECTACGEEAQYGWWKPKTPEQGH